MPTILVVDDDRSIQEMLADALGETGYRVVKCRDGNKVLAQLRASKADLLILDVLIPHKNGFTILEALHADAELATTPVIMISGIYRSRNHRSEMIKRFGVIDYLDKPLPLNKLMGLVGDAVGPGDPELAAEHTHGAGVAAPPATTAPDPKLVEPAADHERQEVEAVSRSRFGSSPFILQGSVKTSPVAAVLGRLWAARKSGGLLLRRAKIKKLVYIRDGEPYGVKSNLVGECLGQLLVRERLISAEECAASIEQMRDSGQRQGEILVAMRSMTEKNLRFALELQLERKLFETFEWEDGEYRFNAALELPAPGPTLEWRGAAIIVEGIRRAFDETRLRGLMLPIIKIPLVHAAERPNFADLGFTAKELAAAQAMQLPRAARELLDTGPLPPADTLRVLYSLIALQQVVPQG